MGKKENKSAMGPWWFVNLWSLDTVDGERLVGDVERYGSRPNGLNNVITYFILG